MLRICCVLVLVPASRAVMWARTHVQLSGGGDAIRRTFMDAFDTTRHAGNTHVGLMHCQVIQPVC